LPSTVKEILCSAEERPESKVKELTKQLNKIDSPFFLDGDKYVKKVTAQQ